MSKVIRKKAGWKIKNRKCMLCNQVISQDKALYQHHICYPDKPEDRGLEVTVVLCWMCHEIVHCRLKYRNPYNKYGRDFASWFMAQDIIRMFSKHPKVLKIIKETKHE